MRHSIFVFLTLLFISPAATSHAEEGMWIPILLNRNIDHMQSMGLKLTAEEIYSINHASLKDAIVMFGRGCTGEIVSPEGLLLTNHHCGFGAIQSLSSLEHDYLANGFWAMSRDQELPARGLTVTLLVRMEEVTVQALEGVTQEMTEKERADRIRTNSAAIEKKAAEGTHYEARVRPFFSGNQYFLFINEVFRDIRLVGAPPSSIGKFGGDTDNWMWPRHTGDFSVFRIYAGPDNKPAEYHPDNVPYRPLRFLPVSLQGYSKGDFTFVFGYPGTTREYVPARAVDFTANRENPARIRLRRQRLDIIGSAMDTNRLIRIQYASKHAGIANYWKKMIGESRGIERLDAVTLKRAEEQHFSEWVLEKPGRKTRYGDLLKAYEALYERYEPLVMTGVYLTEAGLAPEITKLAAGFEDLMTLSAKKGVTTDEIDLEREKRLKAARDFYKNYNPRVDEKIMCALLPEMNANIPARYLPDVFAEIAGPFKGNVTAYAEALYSRSMFADSLKLFRFLASYKPSAAKKILSDPAYRYASSVNRMYGKTIVPGLQPGLAAIDSLQRIFMAAQMEMQTGRYFYPDANSTLRVSYGKVDDYSPADAVWYNYFTTTDGILAKEDPEIADYAVDPKLKQLLQTKDFGPYADRDGTLHVAFTASNHTTGGNSGSPVLNAEGQLLGLNFDRNWEGTMSDLMYDPAQCRNITLDIRYCLFIIDKFAGAGHLLKEMEIIR